MFLYLPTFAFRCLFVLLFVTVCFCIIMCVVTITSMRIHGYVKRKCVLMLMFRCTFTFVLHRYVGPHLLLHSVFVYICSYMVVPIVTPISTFTCTFLSMYLYLYVYLCMHICMFICCRRGPLLATEEQANGQETPNDVP